MGCQKKKLKDKPKSDGYRCAGCGAAAEKKKLLCKPKKRSKK